MKKKLSGVEKREGRDTLGLICLVAAFLFPLGMISVLIRLLSTRGAPVWYLCLHGIVTVGTLIQDVLFFRKGLTGAVHHWRAGRRREGRNE